jgi:Spy/CpxP family protein refolding chaperone
MSVKKTFWIFLLALILGGSPAWTEPWKEGKDPREKSRERIQMMKIWKMTETLKLDREGAARFIAVNNYYEESRRKVRHDFYEDIQRVRNIMRDMNPPERELRELVNRLKNRKREINDLENKQLEEEMNLLKPEQQARYFLFQIDFHREMEDMIREIQGERPPRPVLEKPSERIR